MNHIPLLSSFPQVKAQVHAGGRGKGHFDTGFQGGVHLCREADKAAELVGKMLHNRLITKQTDNNGAKVNAVMIAESLNFDREFYFAILMDRNHHGPVMVGSPCGGMDIEEVSEEHPEKIRVTPVDFKQGPTPQQSHELAKFMGFDSSVCESAAEQIQRLYQLFLASDATQVEINPLVQTTDNRVFAIDAKINFDDNAEFRQKEIFSMHDTTEEDQREVAAAKVVLVVCVMCDVCVMSLISFYYEYLIS
jgi:succinyl-CoA synthetase beta subunit